MRLGERKADSLDTPLLPITDAPYSPWRELFRSRRVRAWAVFVGMVVSVAALMEILVLTSVNSEFVSWLREQGLMPADIFLVSQFAVGVLLAAVAFSAWLMASRRLARRCPSEGVQFVRAPLVGAFSARFEVDGHAVVAYRRSVNVRLVTPGRAQLNVASLRKIASESADFAPYAKAARAASDLVWLGVQSIQVERDQLVVHGGKGPLVDLVRHAVEVVTAPSRLGLHATQREHTLGCPYCHQPLTDLLQDPTLRCTGCDSVSHTECWKEHGGCAVFACTKAPRADAQEQRRATRVPLGE